MPSYPDSPSRSFFDVVLRQRACRRFDPRPVHDDLVEQCLRAAVHAPSAENKQPWVFVVVRDDLVRQQLADLTRRAWREGGRSHSEGRLPAALLDDVEVARRRVAIEQVGPRTADEQADNQTNK